jgi:hypothetical protein
MPKQERVCEYDGRLLERDEAGRTKACPKCEEDIHHHNSWCCDCRVLVAEMAARP